MSRIFQFLYQNEYIYYLFSQNNSIMPFFLCHSSKYMSSFPIIGLETPSCLLRRTKFLYLSQSTGQTGFYGTFRSFSGRDNRDRDYSKKLSGRDIQDRDNSRIFGTGHSGSGHKKSLSRRSLRTTQSSRFIYAHTRERKEQKRDSAFINALRKSDVIKKYCA